MTLSYREFVRQNGLLYFVIAVSYVAIILAYSFHYGRLASIPQYDDVGYFVDAIIRYHILVKDGLWDFIVNLYNNPPLSPVITITAVLAYLLFGIADWSPYILNASFVFFVVTLVGWYFQKDMLLSSMMILLLFTCSLPAWGVHDFRPDILNAFLTALACFLIITCISDKTDERKRYTLAGICLGVALLTKPSAFLFTVGIYISAFISTLSIWMLLERQFNFKLFNKSIYSFLVGIVLTLPYDAFAWEFIYKYVYDALITNKAIWAIPGDRWFHMTYYLTGFGGSKMIGSHLWIVAVMAFPLIWLAKSVKKSQVAIASMVAITILAWFVVSMNVVKTYFLGASFYWLLLMAFAMMFHHAYNGCYNFPVRRKLLLTSLCFAVVVGITTLKHPSYWWQDSKINVEKRDDIIRGITKDIQEIYSIKNAHMKVFMPYKGYFTDHALSYLLLSQGQEDVGVTSYWLNYGEDIPRIYNKYYSSSDVVIIATENHQSLMTTSQGISGKHVEEINNLLLERDDVSLYKTYIAPSGQKIFVYVKKKILQ